MARSSMTTPNTPERGCAESQPQQRPQLNVPKPLGSPSGWQPRCGWSPTQPRSA